MTTPSAPKNPPRFVPTLTEVVDLASSRATANNPANSSQSRREPEANLLVDRVMARLDGPLQLRLRETIGQLAIEHFRKLEPLLREEIDSVVRRAVEDAIARETTLR